MLIACSIDIKHLVVATEWAKFAAIGSLLQWSAVWGNAEELVKPSGQCTVNIMLGSILTFSMLNLHRLIWCVIFQRKNLKSKFCHVIQIRTIKVGTNSFNIVIFPFHFVADSIPQQTWWCQLFIRPRIFKLKGLITTNYKTNLSKKGLELCVSSIIYLLSLYH